MDSISIIAIIAGCTALVVAILTHVRHSTCFGIEVDTYEQPQTTINTPETTHIESKV